MFKLKINNSKPKDWPQIPLIIHNQMCNDVTMNTWDQMWGKTYQCQISNAGGWFISVRFSKFHDFSMTFDDFSKFHDFPWLFQKIVFFQVFQTLWEPGLGRVPDLRVRVQVRVLAICVSTSTSPSTWLLHEYEYEYWLMSMSTSTSTGLWSTFFIACIGSRFLLFGAKIVQYHEMYGKWCIFLKSEVKTFIY